MIDLTATEISQPRLTFNYQAPITGSNFKIYSDNAGVRLCCLENVAYVLDVSFNNRHYGGIEDKLFFETAVAKAGVEIFYAKERNLYYCKLEDLPKILDGATRNFAADYQSTVTDIIYFRDWLNAILPKIFSGKDKILDIFRKHLTEKGFQFRLCEPSGCADFTLEKANQGDVWAKIIIPNNSVKIYGDGQSGFTLKKAKIRKFQKFVKDTFTLLFLYFVDWSTGKVYFSDLDDLLYDIGCTSTTIHLLERSEYVFAFKNYQIAFELTKEELETIRAALTPPKNEVDKLEPENVREADAEVNPPADFEKHQRAVYLPYINSDNKFVIAMCKLRDVISAYDTAEKNFDFWQNADNLDEKGKQAWNVTLKARDYVLKLFYDQIVYAARELVDADLKSKGFILKCERIKE